jgi:hypothetical protein
MMGEDVFRNAQLFARDLNREFNAHDVYVGIERVQHEGRKHIKVATLSMFYLLLYLWALALQDFTLLHGLVDALSQARIAWRIIMFAYLLASFSMRCGGTQKGVCKRNDSTTSYRDLILCRSWKARFDICFRGCVAWELVRLGVYY